MQAQDDLKNGQKNVGPPLGELLVHTVLILCVVMPVYGALIRVRAEFRPLRNPDAELEMNAWCRVKHLWRSWQPQWGDVLEEIHRSYREKGLRSLYRGMTLAFVQITSQTVLSFLLYEQAEKMALEPRWLLILASSLLLSIVDLPFEVLMQRYVDSQSLTHSTVTHREQVRWWNPCRDLSKVLTDQEKREPWQLFFLPGLLYATMARKLIVTLLFLFFERTFFPGPITLQDSDAPGSEGPNVETFTFSWRRLVLYFVWNCVSLAFALPLDCITTRLAIQNSPGNYLQLDDAQDPNASETERQQASTEDDRSSIQSTAQATPTERSRSEQSLLDPPRKTYTGLLNCFLCMLQEEGPSSLTRGAGITLVTLLVQTAGAPAR
ncbi:hypothetical protein MPSI1_003614 [Malassezia psittaci]|uniref:Uncharacterized protein n=1 Tax=Malassezia psittaci TaxID=1821823 RepID=A0AAF0JFP2_9BASI|nr:hypothetical protein MPSI1_003614 [Malassezia psittaci]